MDYAKTHQVLVQLIHANNIRIQNYQTALIIGRIAELEPIFLVHQITSINCISTLSSIKKQKNFLDTITSPSKYSFFKFNLKLKLLLGLKRKNTILKACKKNENIILLAYQNILEKNDVFDISLEIIKTLNLQQMELKKNHDTIMELLANVAV